MLSFPHNLFVGLRKSDHVTVSFLFSSFRRNWMLLYLITIWMETLMDLSLKALHHLGPPPTISSPPKHHLMCLAQATTLPHLLYHHQIKIQFQLMCQLLVWLTHKTPSSNGQTSLPRPLTQYDSCAGSARISLAQSPRFSSLRCGFQKWSHEQTWYYCGWITAVLIFRTTAQCDVTFIKHKLHKLIFPSLWFLKFFRCSLKHC